MNYIKVKWIHDSPEYPILLFSELDAERWEVRKVEMYADGRMDFADGKEQSGNTDLGLVPVPPFEEIASNPIFEPVMMPAEEFEVIWKIAKAKHRAAGEGWK
ncbi:hypothetical protein G3545_08725 [Starkeya sp. ORNL1]|uniref:DUF6881 domain-containing protein n=1 Tax=Starkeya sp. ORNL1 TaxID=2709380 RepID=UPI0014644231|nr:hypothetical protein [Starkeya sp. ORNL1]QJP13734.1 hypothetical protein G3545_08725 [Starkeya sp. ORNL1]